MILGSVILAGGRSRRMGQPKESLPFGDNTLLGRTVDTLLSCTYPVVVVARDAEQELPPFALEAEVAYDESAEEGPLMGIMTGMRAMRGECDAAFVTGCDTPFLTAAAVDWLAKGLGDHEVLMPRVDDVLQPLFAIYRLSVLPRIESAIRDGVHTPRSLAEGGNVRILTEEEIDAFDASRDFLRNVNSPEAYRAALERLEA